MWTAAKGALQWRMPIEMRQKNASEIKRRMSGAVQSTPALQFQLIPAPPPFQQVDTGSFFIMIPVFKYHLLSLHFFSLLKSPHWKQHPAFVVEGRLWVSPRNAPKVFWVTQIPLISRLSPEKWLVYCSSVRARVRGVCTCLPVHVDSHICGRRELFLFVCAWLRYLPCSLFTGSLI